MSFIQILNDFNHIHLKERIQSLPRWESAFGNKNMLKTDRISAVFDVYAIPGRNAAAG